MQDTEHAGRPRDGSWIDLHGCEMDYVTGHLFPAFLLHAVGQQQHRHVEIITGAGHHSADALSVVKQWVWSAHDSLLNRAVRGEVPGLVGLRYEAETEGSVRVNLADCEAAGAAAAAAPSAAPEGSAR